MHSQPSQSVAAPAAPSSAAALHLAVSVGAAVVLAAMVYIDLFTLLTPSRAGGALLAAICAVGGYGYINRAAEDRTVRRTDAAVGLILDRLDALDKRADGIDAKIIEQGEQVYASAFVAGASGGRHLTAVRQG